MTTETQKLKAIDKERKALTREIGIAQARLGELAIQRQNIIMKEA